MSDTVVYAINKGIHYLGISDPSLIKEESFKWEGSTFEVGTSFEKLGSKDRTSLNIGTPLIFSGYLIDGLKYILLDPGQPKVYQTSLFEESNYKWYIAPMYVDEHCLLMPSSSNGFWDIRC